MRPSGGRRAGSERLVLAADAEILTSELMTNATQASASVDPDEPIALRLLANRGGRGG
ncbi:MAG TPA: hypothetical protein VMG38_16110 [Trebonia sp.]|nr:hypothetical protein [Trebonia sp.]